MTLFVSYTKSDDDVVRTIRADLEQLGHVVWMDHQIHGGESWWREIIHEIQGAAVFVFALSNSSWKSKPCRLELDYANDLGLPVLPLQVGPLDHKYIQLAERQIIDFRERTADGMVKLVNALTEMLSREVTLPDPLPEPPPVPFEYLYRIASVMGPNRITPERQEELIGTLRRKLREEDDPLARVDIVKLLRELKERNEITVPNAREVEEILASAPNAPEPEDGATRLPPADHWRKTPSTDGTETTTAGTATPPAAAAGPEAASTPQPATGSAGTPEVTVSAPGATAAGSEPGREATTGREAETGSSGSASAAPESQVAAGSGRGSEGNPVPGTERRPAAAGGWPGAGFGANAGAASEAGASASPAGQDPAQQGGAPGWLVDLMRTDPNVGRPVPPPQQQPTPEPAVPQHEGTGWWHGQSPPPGPPHPEQAVEGQPAKRGLRFGWLSIALGVVGVIFLIVALAGDEDARFPLLAIVALLVGVLGLSVGVVAVARQESGARTAAIVAAIGLVGAIGYAAATWS